VPLPFYPAREDLWVRVLDLPGKFVGTLADKIFPVPLPSYGVIGKPAHRTHKFD